MPEGQFNRPLYYSEVGVTMTIRPESGFGNIPEEYKSYHNAAVAIVPVSYDETATWKKGSRYGPNAIIEASGHLELYDIETDSEVYLEGIYTDHPINESGLPEDLVQEVRTRVAKHLAYNKFVVCLGGEHSISIGTIQAYAKKYEDLSVLQLDAHADLQDEYNGSRYNHNCVMARVLECCDIVQVGIRSMDHVETRKIKKGTVFFADAIMNGGNWISDVVNKLSKNVYITIDLDVFDLAVMPATGTPEPGGLSWHQVISLLKKVTEKRSVVGFDVVELCPSEYSYPQDYLAAKLIYKLLSYIYKEDQNGKKRYTEYTH